MKKQRAFEKRDCTAINLCPLLFWGSEAQVCGGLDTRFSPAHGIIDHIIKHFLTFNVSYIILHMTRVSTFGVIISAE